MALFLLFKAIGASSAIRLRGALYISTLIMALLWLFKAITASSAQFHRICEDGNHHADAKVPLN